MIAINLTDWRNKNIIIMNRRFAVMQAAAIAAWLVVAGLIYLMIHGQINSANADITYLNTQLNSVAGLLDQIKKLQAQKDLLLSRRKLIESLQDNRVLTVSIFDNVVRAMPDGVVLNEFSRKNNDLTLSGVGDSNYSVSLLMENIQRLPWVKSAKIGELKTNEDKNVVSANANPETQQIGFELIIGLNATDSGAEHAAT